VSLISLIAIILVIFSQVNFFIQVKPELLQHANNSIYSAQIISHQWQPIQEFNELNWEW